ncbi:MAG: hypothetical protein ACP5HU_07295 [Phycisphaerae bacterium]
MPKRMIAALAILTTVSVTALLTGDPSADGTENRDEPQTRPAPQRRGPTLSEEQEQEILEVLKEHQLGQYQRLMELREEDPDRYQAAVHAAWRWYRRWKSMPEEVQQAANDARNAKIAIYRVTRELRDVEDSYMRTRLVGELRQAIRQEFQAELVVREYRLNQLEAELKRLREELRQRREDSEEIISQRLQRHFSEHVGTTTQPVPQSDVEDGEACCPQTAPAQ